MLYFLTVERDPSKSDKKTIQVESPIPSASEEVIQREGKISFQRMSSSGRIHVSKKGWLFRLTMLASLIGITSYYTLYGIKIGNSFVVYSTIMLVYSVMIWVVGWFFFKSKITPVEDNGLVSMIIPIYNQKDMIKVVIEAAYASSYKNLEVIAINDGSTDGTKEILDELSKRFSNLKVIHQTNQGKRKAVAKGFQIS